ncbi:hypothetical protein M0Q97_13780 [Candidatus Dojkabacteria bacterium]|jgi:hypothetical protein|nr:hypothetical protein [Candidatus Dojkabacteria bacterium]
MKLKIEFIDENTGQKIVIKNKNSKVMYHNSDVHDSGEFEELTGKVMKFEPNEKELVNTSYKLAGSVNDSY